MHPFGGFAFVALLSTGRRGARMANEKPTKPPRKRSVSDVVEGFINDVLGALNDLVNPEPEPVLIPIRRRPRRY